MSLIDPVYVIGAGGQGKVVISTLQALGVPIAGILSDRHFLERERVMGIRILGPVERLNDVANPCAVLAIGDNNIRKGIAEKFPAVRWGTFVHPRAWVHCSVCLGPGTVIFAGAMIQPDAVLGRHCIVNTGATVDHDCCLGDYVHVAPGAHLAGGVHLREGVLLGIGSSVIPQKVVGAWSLIGAGGVVVRDMPEMVVAKGVPARYEDFTDIMRDVTERKRTAALLRATFDSTAEGVLSVDEHGHVTNYNQRYVDMWRVPKELTVSGDDEALVQHALEQVKDADAFLDRVEEAFQNPRRETTDEIELRDGRIIERVSVPQLAGDQVAGRVWSFRDVTAWCRAEQRFKSLNDELEARIEARTSELVSAKQELELINEQLLHDAFHDPLTGLANRTLFLDRLDLVIKRSPRGTNYTFAVLLIDVDRLKVVNDSLGRAVGDKLLIGLGERLLSCVRPGDTVARVSQDEFAVLLEGVRGLDEAERAVLRFKEEVRKPFLLGDQVVHTSVSIGGVLSNNAAYDDVGYGGAEGMLRDAGIAMTRAKALGIARYQMFTAELRERAFNLQALESDLHSVTERQELSVFYQPILSLLNGSLSGFEALVRWEHPKLGMVSPTEFIPIAEDTGLIIDVDRWVLREACEQLSRWQRQLPLAPPLAINVNLSSQQFLRTDLVDYVRGVLDETGVQPEHLKLEITESVLMQSSAAVKVVFEQFKALGVKLYIDDFGTGYSSLSYLQSFPVDSLKIDRSFVNNMTVSPERAELVKTILAMARTLKLDVVAEGIETEAQRTQLTALGCTYGQGYLFAKPLRIAEASTFLETACRSDFARVSRR